MLKVARLNFHPPRARPWLREGVPTQASHPAQEFWSSPQPGSSRQCPAQLRRQISAQDALRARPPDSIWPSSLREPGTQHPADLRLLRLSKLVIAMLTAGAVVPARC